MVKNLRYMLFGIAFAIISCTTSGIALAGPAWSIEGEYFEGCTCNPGCPCLFGSEPTHNKTCRITGVFRIVKGNYGQHSLDDQTVIGITDLTAQSDRNWIVFYINDKTASAVQKNALEIYSKIMCLVSLRSRRKGLQ